MKLTVERDNLIEALAPAYRIAKPKQSIPILNHVLLRADGMRLRIAGNDLGACAEAGCAAGILEPGSCAVVGESLQKLAQKMPKGSLVTIELSDTELAVRFGRSRYKLPTLPPGDFPLMLSVENAIEFQLTADQVETLFGRTRPFAEDADSARFYLAGVHLREGKGGALIGEASNGTQLMQRALKVKGTKGLKPAIVPNSAVDAILDLAGEGGTFRCAQALIQVEAKGATFTSKLVDGTFPDLQRAIPDIAAGHISCDREELIAAIERLMAINTGDSAIAFRWEADAEQFTLSLRGDGEGTEAIGAEIKGLAAGEFGAAPSLFRSMLQQTPGELIEIYYIGPGDAVRIGQKLAPDLVGVVMPRRI